MAITIVVETGEGLQNSNSYVSVNEARSFATERGIVLPANDDEVASLLIQSMDYLEAQACKYQGRRTSVLQALQWPRTGVTLEGDTFPPNAIPSQLVKAQLQLMSAAAQGFDLLPNVSPQDFVTQETVGPITTKYADMTSVGVIPTFSAAEALLAPLFGDCAKSGAFLTTLRV